MCGRKFSSKIWLKNTKPYIPGENLPLKFVETLLSLPKNTLEKHRSVEICEKSFVYIFDSVNIMLVVVSLRRSELNMGEMHPSWIPR